jgi:hypothetical protein
MLSRFKASGLAGRAIAAVIALASTGTGAAIAGTTAATRARAAANDKMLVCFIFANAGILAKTIAGAGGTARAGTAKADDFVYELAYGAHNAVKAVFKTVYDTAKACVKIGSQTI